MNTNFTPNQLTVILPKVGDRLEVIGAVSRYGPDDNFMMFFNTGLQQISKDKNLVGQDLRVFLALAALVKDTNKICISQRELADFLDIHPSDVSKSTLRLNELNYLVIVDRIGKQNVYMLNPEIIFKGTKDKRDAAIKEYNNPMNLPKVAVKRIGELLPKSSTKPTTTTEEIPY